MMIFFCTRCGARLQIDDALGGQRVRCGHCSNVVGSPEPAEDVPVAFVVEDDTADAFGDAEVESLLGLEADPNTASTPARPTPRVKLPAGQTVDGLVEQLERVEAAAEASGMTDCPHCGSTIAAYVGRCPFCRHPLRGS